MDGMVEENGPVVVDQLTHTTAGGNASAIITSVQSVIQANKQSVIQTAAGNIQLKPGNVILVKPNSVIQTTPGNIQALQVVDADSDDDMSPRKRRDVLTRRPSYRKILNEIDEIAGNPGHKVESSSECDSNLDSELSSHSLSTHYSTVIPAGTIQINSQVEAVQGLHTITMTNATAAGGLVQYTSGQDGPFYVPGEDGQLATIVVTQGGGLSGGSVMPEDQSRKREMRLLKNREAARECRRKKKEYIKCLENRVAVLENQNKALIDELKSLKELYCQTKSE
ncbi:cAMP-responsive element modulator isoform X1 [Thrips palmi]|uniref:cAMP-responsive element modulator isoform X1 n=1 Tax=Thrips palmi TaxID=161013 RepID=A0A6P8YXG5_THRPL|nr:cAMP-responsive element modulator isoform X1 [Thrips palmi]XP_034241971.1 cAMP-responsive element modulator isoform X1 [Thrips palmi]XP_034241972.1 cAMP-responsive element modulator isoform X1 [Thrips palmi]